MSLKRRATTELNHDNWDEEDSTEPEEMGTSKIAPKDVLEKRIIRTAKRRSQISSDEPKKSVFSGFGGFNKIQQSSFDFLANLTNGSKTTTEQPTTKADTAVSTSIFTNKSLSSSPSTGIFSMSGSSAFATKPTVGKSPEGSLFGGSTVSNTSPIQSVFTGSKADSTVNDSPFKLQSSPKTGTISDMVAKPNTNPDVSTSQVSSTIFGVPSNSSVNKSLFSSTVSNATLLTTQPVSSTSTTTTNSATTSTADANVSESSSESDDMEERRQRYHSRLKGLNQSVSDWIKKHVTKTPLCILSPIFKDYEKYLREIKLEYTGGEEVAKITENKVETKSPPEEKTTPANNNVSSSIFGNLSSSNTTKTELSKNNIGTTSSSFKFGINPSTATTTVTGFTGIKSSPTSNPSSLFPATTIAPSSLFPATTNAPSSLFPATTNAPCSLFPATTNASAPFSFGISKSGFSFNTNTIAKTETAPETKEEDDEPPKVEYTPVVEENSVFDTKCKIFIKKDGNFVDKGVGTLYIKKIEESGKHQLLVRANTNLGNILLNLVLSSSIPAQRMGKNNVMLVCIPTPDAKPPPAPILIRVKTAEEADDLLGTLNKYKA